MERRRRETINEGINELAKIVPGNEKNKGSILQRAIAFITQLKENEAQNIEKWTLEKLLTADNPCYTDKYAPPDHTLTAEHQPELNHQPVVASVAEHGLGLDATQRCAF